MRELTYLLEVPEMQEFHLIGSYIPPTYRYRINLNRLEYQETDGSWSVSRIPINHILDAKIQLIPWEPADEEVFWYPVFDKPTLSAGKVRHLESVGLEKMYQRIKNEVGVFPTEEEATEAARKRGWING